MFSSTPKAKKGNLLVYLISLIAIVGIMFSLHNCTGKGMLGSKASGGDTIDVGIQYSPLSCYTYDDTVGGFCHDLLMLIGRRNNVTFKFQPVVALQKSLDDLNRGNFKILVTELPVTKEYKEKFLFTDPVYLDRQVLVQRSDSRGNVKIKNQLALAGQTVYIVKGSSMRSRLESLGREIGDTIHIATDDVYGPEQLFLRVATGEISYAVVNEKVAQTLSPRYPHIDAGTAVSFTQFQSWTLKKSDAALCAKMNQWLKDIKGTKEYKQLCERYFK
jgi:membrane-bound lytic murein transglycosylase F